MTPWLCCLALGVMPALGQVGSTAIYTEFQGQPPDAVLESMREEVASIMAPAGLHFEWRSLDQPRVNEVFTDLAVAKFKGRCDAASLLRTRITPGALAWSHVSDGEVLPFTDVDCDRIRDFLQYLMIGLEPKVRDKVFGRAIGRVLAHELFHIFARDKGHGSRDVDQPSYNPRQLVDDEFGIVHKALHVLRIRPLRAEKSRTARPTNGSVQAGLSVFSKSGCGACHGSQGQGTRRAPALRVAGEWIDSVVLAARLERDAPKMYRRARDFKVPAPSVSEDDLADLVRFLNDLAM